MAKYWIILGVVTVAAFLIVIAPFLPQRAPIGAAPEMGENPENNSVNILFVGDIMLDRSVAVHARAAGDQALFAGVASLFENHDAIIGNLEGAITDNPSVSQQDNSILRFTFDPKYADLLGSLGFSALSLANNHALDFGEFGYEDTIAYLQSAGVAAFGSPYNDAHLAISMTIKDRQICFIGYHELFTSDTTAVLAKIREIRPMCDKIILLAHWGVEYQHQPTQEQRDFAHAFIDAGADVIIGSHPHVVEPLEIYKNHAIFYSLGNFLFDQGFQPEVKRGLAVAIEFSDTATKFTLTPVTTYKEVSIADATTSQAVLAEVGVATTTFKLAR
jgi:poly-gamma-glutamate synthesis protein (capsule biosynthesis protein)